MHFINFAVVKFAICLALGIIAARFFPEYPLLYLLPFLFMLLVFLWFRARKQLFQDTFFGIVALSCFFFIGFGSYQLRTPRFQPKHYSHAITERQSYVLQLKIKEILKPGRYHNKYIVAVKALNDIPVQGKLLLSIQKDSISEILDTDALLLVSAPVLHLNEPLNPYQFNYANYLKTLGVYHQLRISENSILKTREGRATLKGHAERFRNRLVKALERISLDKDERSILQALVLGQKRDIDKALYADYAAAGAVHILAVSGLHIGVFFFIFSWLFRPLLSFRHGNQARSILVILCLFGFAFITGASPSVVRAATMFSLFAFAELINRPTNSFNTLFLSFFILLLINPFWLFHIGFQLSYLAVFSILWIHPLCNKLYSPRNRWIRKVWDIITVSIAAQLGVLPLSLYYFHQFPGLFLLTNIVVLPFLALLLGAGLLVLLLSAVEALPEKIAVAYNFLIRSLNDFIRWVASQDHLLIEEIHFSEANVLATYGFIVTLALLWKQFSYRALTATLASILVLISTFLWERHALAADELLVLHSGRKTLLAYKHANKLTAFSEKGIYEHTNTSALKAFGRVNRVTTITEAPLPKFFKYRSRSILVIDSTGIYPSILKPDIVFLIQSPPVHLERLIDELQPGLILADGSNYTSYVNRWRKTCKARKLPFHHTGSKGAFAIE